MYVVFCPLFGAGTWPYAGQGQCGCAAQANAPMRGRAMRLYAAGIWPYAGQGQCGYAPQAPGIFACPKKPGPKMTPAAAGLLLRAYT